MTFPKSLGGGLKFLISAAYDRVSSPPQKLIDWSIDARRETTLEWRLAIRSPRYHIHHQTSSWENPYDPWLEVSFHLFLKKKSNTFTFTVVTNTDVQEYPDRMSNDWVESFRSSISIWDRIRERKIWSLFRPSAMNLVWRRKWLNPSSRTPSPDPWPQFLVSVIPYWPRIELSASYTVLQVASRSSSSSYRSAWTHLNTLVGPRSDLHSWMALSRARIWHEMGPLQSVIQCSSYTPL